MAPSRAALAKIHIARKELNIPEDAYQDMLALHFQVTSASKLTESQAAVHLDIFRARGWQPKKGKGATGGKRPGGDFITIKPGPAARQQRKVLAMWNALGYGMDKLHARCRLQFQVDRFEWLIDGQALHVLITDLGTRLEAKKERR